MKRKISLIMILAIICRFCIAFADISENNSVMLLVGCSTAMQNGKKVLIDDDEEVVPQIKDGRTYIPIKFMGDAFGWNVEWDNSSKTAVLSDSNTKIEITIGEKELKKNDEIITLDAPAMIMNDRTMLPLRSVAEAFGKEVFWDRRGFIAISDEEMFKTAYEKIQINTIIKDLLSGADEETMNTAEGLQWVAQNGAECKMDNNGIYTVSKNNIEEDAYIHAAKAVLPQKLTTDGKTVEIDFSVCGDEIWKWARQLLLFNGALGNSIFMIYNWEGEFCINGYKYGSSIGGYWGEYKNNEWYNISILLNTDKISTESQSEVKQKKYKIIIKDSEGTELWSTENKNNYPNGTLYIPDELSSLSWAYRTNVKGDWSLRFKDLKVGYEEDFNNEGGALSNAAKPIKKVVKDPTGTHGTGTLPPTPGDNTGIWLASDSWAKIEENNKEITVSRKFKQGSSLKYNYKPLTEYVLPKEISLNKTALTLNMSIYGGTSKKIRTALMWNGIIDTKAPMLISDGSMIFTDWSSVTLKDEWYDVELTLNPDMKAYDVNNMSYKIMITDPAGKKLLNKQIKVASDLGIYIPSKISSICWSNRYDNSLEEDEEYKFKFKDVTVSTETDNSVIRSVKILNGDTVSLSEPLELKAAVDGDFLSNYDVQWYVENETGKARISENYLIPEKAGTVKLIAKAAADPNFSDSKQITIEEGEKKAFWIPINGSKLLKNDDGSYTVAKDNFNIDSYTLYADYSLVEPLSTDAKTVRISFGMKGDDVWTWGRQLMMFNNYFGNSIFMLQNTPDNIATLTEAGKWYQVEILLNTDRISTADQNSTNQKKYRIRVTNENGKKIYEQEFRNNYPNGTLYVPDEIKSIQWGARSATQGDWRFTFRDVSLEYAN